MEETSVQDDAAVQAHEVVPHQPQETTWQYPHVCDAIEGKRRRAETDTSHQREGKIGEDDGGSSGVPFAVPEDTVVDQDAACQGEKT